MRLGLGFISIWDVEGIYYWCLVFLVQLAVPGSRWSGHFLNILPGWFCVSLTILSVTSEGHICCQQVASGVQLEFRKTVSVKQFL
jgi:hypothetical protein